MDGIDNIPSEDEPIYITGAGTEDNGDETRALQMLRQDDGIYQTFVRLKANQPYVSWQMLVARNVITTPTKEAYYANETKEKNIRCR